MPIQIVVFLKLPLTLSATPQQSAICQRSHDRLYLHGPHPRKTVVWNHGLDPLRTMALKSPFATTSVFFSIARCQGGDFQDHGSEDGSGPWFCEGGGHAGTGRRSMTCLFRICVLFFTPFLA